MQEIENYEFTKKTAIIMPKCLEMLQEAMAYIAENSQTQAEIMFEQFYEKINRIENMPGIGTIYKNGMRKMPLGKFRYFIYYRENENYIEILGIWHTSRGTEFIEREEGL